MTDGVCPITVQAGFVQVTIHSLIRCTYIEGLKLISSHRSTCTLVMDSSFLFDTRINAIPWTDDIRLSTEITDYLDSHGKVCHTYLLEHGTKIPLTVDICYAL